MLAADRRRDLPHQLRQSCLNDTLNPPPPRTPHVAHHQALHNQSCGGRCSNISSLGLTDIRAPCRRWRLRRYGDDLRQSSDDARAGAPTTRRSTRLDPDGSARKPGSGTKLLYITLFLSFYCRRLIEIITPSARLSAPRQPAIS